MVNLLKGGPEGEGETPSGQAGEEMLGKLPAAELLQNGVDG